MPSCTATSHGSIETSFRVKIRWLETQDAVFNSLRVRKRTLRTRNLIVNSCPVKPPSRRTNRSAQRWKPKRGQPIGRPRYCARDESRTHTSQLTLAPETSASTISPPALEVDCKDTDYLRNCKQNQAPGEENYLEYLLKVLFISVALPEQFSRRALLKDAMSFE